MKVPNVWLRPLDQRREGDAAKALLSVPDGDHLRRALSLQGFNVRPQLLRIMERKDDVPVNDERTSQARRI